MTDNPIEKSKLRLALIGKDVSGSSSGKIHEFILHAFGVDCEYEKVSVPNADDFPIALPRLFAEFDGFNVTIPYKQKIINYINKLHGDAEIFGAVNTVLSKSRSGYNTDGAGFMLMLETEKISLRGKTVLVLGGGGAGRSVAAVLKKSGADVELYRRNQAELLKICGELGVFPAENPENALKNAEKTLKNAEKCSKNARKKYEIIVNCTGVGMHKSIGISPLSEEAIAKSGCSVAVDLIYRPEESEFLRLAKKSGARTLNGEKMLFYQAYFSDCLYLNREANAAEGAMLYELYKSN